MAAIEVADLITSMKDHYDGLQHSMSMPIPLFHGKKDENPEDHLLKVEDYFSLNKVTTDNDKIDHFKDTCQGKVSHWVSSLDPMPTTWDAAAGADADAKKASLRWQFLQRWSIQGHTPEAIYAEWQKLSFDPYEDDFEDFCGKVKNLAQLLNYDDTSQAVVIKASLPTELANLCMNLKTSKELKSMVTTALDTPQYKSKYMQGKGKTGGGTSAFSITATDNGLALGKLQKQVQSLSLELSKMSVTEPQSREMRYKPEMTPSH